MILLGLKYKAANCLSSKYHLLRIDFIHLHFVLSNHPKTLYGLIASTPTEMTANRRSKYPYPLLERTLVYLFVIVRN